MKSNIILVTVLSLLLGAVLGFIAGFIWGHNSAWDVAKDVYELNKQVLEIQESDKD